MSDASYYSDGLYFIIDKTIQNSSTTLSGIGANGNINQPPNLRTRYFLGQPIGAAMSVPTGPAVPTTPTQILPTTTPDNNQAGGVPTVPSSAPQPSIPNAPMVPVTPY